MPKVLIVRPMVESEKISLEDQREYQSSMGMPLYLVNYSRQEIANMITELSNNDGANPAALKELI